jgi:hypothetical protein
MRRLITTLAGLGLTFSIATASVAAGGPPAASFYVDGVLFRTVATPTDLSRTGAPAHSYDTIYALGGLLSNVAEAKPGDADYNGGRWMVLPIIWTAGVTPVQLTSAEQVLDYAEDGLLTIGTEPVKQFVCPVIAVPGG